MHGACSQYKTLIPQSTVNTRYNNHTLRPSRVSSFHPPKLPIAEQSAQNSAETFPKEIVSERKQPRARRHRKRVSPIASDDAPALQLPRDAVTAAAFCSPHWLLWFPCAEETVGHDRAGRTPASDRKKDKEKPKTKRTDWGERKKY